MESLVRKEANDAIDGLEVALLERFNKIDFPLNHVFVPGMYIREIFMRAGSKLTSKIHKYSHPYFVMKGSANVWVDGLGWQLITAPYVGITEAGTRRVLDILEDCNWITVHSNPDDTEDLELIEERIIEKHENALL
jgi:hypothetical protein